MMSCLGITQTKREDRQLAVFSFMIQLKLVGLALLLLQLIQCLLLLLAETQLFAGLLKADPRMAHHDIQ